MTYVDGFLIPVAKNKIGQYKKMAKGGKKLWMKYGALEYFECVGDDLNANMGGMKYTKFPKAAGAKPGDKVILSFIVFKSRKHRDAVNAKVMKDPSMNENMPMPFDMKRMVYGGFKTIVEA